MKNYLCTICVIFQYKFFFIQLYRTNYKCSSRVRNTRANEAKVEFVGMYTHTHTHRHTQVILLHMYMYMFVSW